MEKHANKVFIISLDGATFDVLRPLMEQGYMPNLQRLAQGGVTAGLESVIPWVTAPAWTSFMTGKNPDKHGLFDFTRFEESEYRWKINNSTSIKSKTIWQLLSEQGKQMIVLNLPYTYPPYPVNGIMVSGWDAPLLQEGFTYPAQVSKTILEMMPDYGSNLDLPLGSNFPTQSDELFNRFTGKLVRGVEQGAELALHLLGRQTWDVFMIHFQQTDWMQHNLWSYIEEAARNSNNKSARIEKVRSCYRSYDNAVGILLNAVEEINPTVLVLSDHGFGSHRGDVFPNYWLNQWGYFTPTGSPNGNGSSSRWSAKTRSKSKHLLQRAVSRAKGLLTNVKAPDLSRFKSFEEQLLTDNIPRNRMTVDWTRTKAALVVGSEAGFVFVNVKGRGPLGTVDREDYDEIVSDLVKRFREVRDPKTATKLFSRVERGSTIYPNAGDGVQIPDLVLIPSEGYGLSYAVSDTAPEPSTHGRHRREGVMFLRGQYLKSDLKEFRPRLIDMAPTILHMLGLPVPSDMDGRVLEELFTTPQDVTYQVVNNALTQTVLDYNEQETELIEDRLKALGYIE